MVGYLVVAARNRHDLYEYLKRQFSEDNKVEVLLDRRRADRRRRPEPHEPERRRNDRRSGPGKDDRLYYYGLLIVRQLPGAQLRPPPWVSRVMTEESVGLISQRGLEGAKASEARERVTGWITEGVRMSGVVAKLLREHGHLTARAEAAERKVERLEEEINRVRRENDHFRKQRAQMAEVLKTLAKELVHPLSGKHQ